MFTNQKNLALATTVVEANRVTLQGRKDCVQFWDPDSFGFFSVTTVPAFRILTGRDLSQVDLDPNIEASFDNGPVAGLARRPAIPCQKASLWRSGSYDTNSLR
jgi:hypothetical protein